jgi:hypothetical protein
MLVQKVSIFLIVRFATIIGLDICYNGEGFDLLGVEISTSL